MAFISLMALMTNTLRAKKANVKGFTKRKFLSLNFKQQHKKCAECVRLLYVNRMQASLSEEDCEVYQQLLQWLGEPKFLVFSLENLSNAYHYHRLLAEQKHQEHHLLPQARSHDRTVGENFWPIHIYLENLRSAHNVGSIIRTIEAFRLGTLYFSATTPFVDHAQVKATAMGADAFVSCYKLVELSELPRPLIALETSDEAESINDFIFPSSFSIAVGNEEYGCSTELLKQADYILEIPLRGCKNSLNVANAFAITAAAIARQKHLHN